MRRWGVSRKRAEADGADEIAVIGGGEIYRQALPHADRIYLTEVDSPSMATRLFPRSIRPFGRKRAARTSRRDPRTAPPSCSGSLTGRPDPGPWRGLPLLDLTLPLSYMTTKLCRVRTERRPSA